MTRDDVAGCDYEPAERFGWKCLASTPGDGEDFSNDVVGVGGTAVPHRVGVHARRELVIGLREAPTVMFKGHTK